MKIVAIGDTHGRRNWFFIKERVKDADKIVFIGDYFDTHESVSATVQINNFERILEFKKENPDKVVLLLGNHDFHYIRSDGPYSGYQNKYALEIGDVLNKAVDTGLVQVAYEADGWIFTHAGITKTWANLWGIDPKKPNLSGQINGLFYRTPFAFNFTFGKSGDVYGGAVENGPLWVRPEALVSDKIEGFEQAVGHTTQQKLTFVDKLAFIDCLGNSGEFLTLVDGIVSK